MTVRLPPGVRDYLPVAAARRRGVAAALVTELERWGYRAVTTPAYEYDEVLRRGLGASTRSVRFVEPSSGEIAAFRPDLTPQIARLVATRLHDEPGPVRLAYEGSVVRVPEGARGQGELFQVGVELIDAPTAGGDLEVVALAEAALAAAGIDALTIDLGHAAIVRAALDGLELDEETSAALHLALSRKDVSAVEAIVARGGVPRARRGLVCALPSLYGGVEVLARARRLVSSGPARDSVARAALDGLEQLIDRLSSLGPATRLSVDLGEVRGFDYYTGTRFALFAEGVGGAIGSGGRYDDLVERYGRPARAAGFAIDVDRAVEVLRARGAPAPVAAGGSLVGGEPVAANRLAARIRASGARAVLELEEPPHSVARLKARAARQGLDRVVQIVGGRLRWQTLQGGAGELAGADLAALLEGGPTSALDALLRAR